MKLFIRLTILLLIGGVQFANAQITAPPPGDNPKSVTTQYIGSLCHVTIEYNSPDVTAPNGEDRTGKIWGQLVPYGLAPNNFGTAPEIPWRAGANENTTITFSHDMEVQGQPIQAGTYGFHVIPKADGPWTLIFSNNSTAWGSYFYDTADDALRVEATPEESEYHEWLTFEFVDRQPAQTTVALKWENLALPFTIAVPDINDLYLANMRKELQNMPGFSYQSWVQAVGFCLQNDTNLEEALVWADNAISAPFIGQKNFTTLSTKAQVLMKLGRNDEAIAVLNEAVNHPTADPGQIHQVGRQLIGMGMAEQALKVFTVNYEKNDGAWPTNVGMARGLSAVGKYDEALKHAKMALEQAPDELNRNNLRQVIEKLKNKEDIN